MPRFPLVGAAMAAACLLTAPLAAQTKPATKDSAKAKPAEMDHSKMDHSKMDHAKMDHGAMHGGDKAASWKELDAYHQLMMATWHPAKDKNDLAPIRAKARDMVASAKLVAASKAPASCAGKAEIAKAQAALPGETEKVALLAAGTTADAELKAALKGLHDAFEVLEQGCGGGMKH